MSRSGTAAEFIQYNAIESPETRTFRAGLIRSVVTQGCTGRRTLALALLIATDENAVQKALLMNFHF